MTIIGLCSQTPYTSDPVTIEVLDAAYLPIVEDVTINEPGVATITASSENLLWYDEEFATEPVGEGNTFETEFFETQISYWVEANAIYPGVNETGGKEDNSGLDHRRHYQQRKSHNPQQEDMTVRRLGLPQADLQGIRRYPSNHDRALAMSLRSLPKEGFSW